MSSVCERMPFQGAFGAPGIRNCSARRMFQTLLVLVLVASASACDFLPGIEYSCLPCGGEFSCSGTGNVCDATEVTGCDLPADSTYWECCETYTCDVYGTDLCPYTAPPAPGPPAPGPPPPAPGPSSSSSDGLSFSSPWLWAIGGGATLLVIVALIVVGAVMYRQGTKTGESKPLV